MIDLVEGSSVSVARTELAAEEGEEEAVISAAAVAADPRPAGQSRFLRPRRVVNYCEPLAPEDVTPEPSSRRESRAAPVCELGQGRQGEGGGSEHSESESACEVSAI